MARKKAAAREGLEYSDFFMRNIYDAYYLAQGLLGGQGPSQQAAEEAFRRTRDYLNSRTETELGNLLLQNVVEVCRMRMENSALEGERSADYIALMSMPLRARLVLMLADVLRLPDDVIAEVMHTRGDRLRRTLKEARADLAQRAGPALAAHETAEHVLYRNAEPLTAEMVQHMWVHLGGMPEDVEGWQEPDMKATFRPTWPMALALAVALVTLLGLVGVIASRTLSRETPPETVETQPGETVPYTVPVQADAPLRTPSPLTTAPAEAETLDGDVVVLTLGGDTVLGGLPVREDRSDSFGRLSKGAADYPFLNLLPLFADDDLTVLNLACALTERSQAAEGQDYPFRGKPEYAAMLTAGSVEAVTLENGHSGDFGPEGLADTKDALRENRVNWADGEKSLVYTTKAGLKVGVASLEAPFSTGELESAIAGLKQQGAGCVVLSLDWGEELAQTPTQEQIDLAHAAVDLGADIIVGHRAHVVQPAETYKGRPIFYCLGNTAYGGNSNPTDRDIALARVTVICQGNAVVKVDWIGIGGCVSGVAGKNNFQPTLYAPGTRDTLRVMEKLGMTNGQLAQWKLIYDRLWPETPEETETTPAE